MSVYLPVTAQTQHVFGVSPAARVAHAGLAGEEWLEAFPLQAFQHGDGGDPGIVLASGCVFLFPPASVLHGLRGGHGVSGSHNQNDWLIA
ncbi:hypothetical protein [Escherichia coli]|uniref:hypothetical protein n=1 Tax=Escherichia coli TaxID=562 RepID=UPI003D6727CC